jgi:hypothetical protein
MPPPEQGRFASQTRPFSGKTQENRQENGQENGQKNCPENFQENLA